MKKYNTRKRKRKRKRKCVGKRTMKRTGNKKYLIGLEKKRNKTKRRILNITCSIKKEKLNRNKCLKGKKKMMRLTKRICKMGQMRIKLQNKLRKLHIKNNKCY